ncbi:hypothetical protein [Paenibacillus radicis (ex Xue et al. 2023)]|uniref:Asp/Glu/hydantoin racemase n=1 Tax=Paenibacillus radicis (ex Xue et al. 2023) TaxID=2972489 RepID=A0ABT1YPZ3_9BACL|nr:hypothetical protein [Paenibacillus radicis (ex Xue et al. 2023)]MCR8635252.1 hypothetical protein [Paenibacillus radicis (ex Xue et al. 2023)]
MTRRIGCYHAHYSNIEYIQQALECYDVELSHFVDPGLDRLKGDADFSAERGQRKIADMLGWIASCHVDAILVTCTYFTANLTEELEQALPVPVIKIDDPMLALICANDEPQLLVFTNPATVNGTMNRMHQYARSAGRSPQLQAHLLENTFELIMQGKKQAYIEMVKTGLERLSAQYPDQQLWAVQLSMVPAAVIASSASRDSKKIGNPLKALVEELVSRLELKRIVL